MPMRKKLRPTREGMWVRTERRRRGWSIKTLREEIRKRGHKPPSERTLRNIETGEVDEPHFTTQSAVAAGFGVDPNTVWVD